MNEKILSVKELFENGINKEHFFKLVLNITNGGFGEQSRAYANRLKIEQWKELYSSANVGLDLNEKQLTLFLEYMAKYWNNYVSKNNQHFIVDKNFSNDVRKEENFTFESIVFSVLEITLNNSTK